MIATRPNTGLIIPMNMDTDVAAAADVIWAPLKPMHARHGLLDCGMQNSHTGFLHLEQIPTDFIEG